MHNELFEEKGKDAVKFARLDEQRSQKIQWLPPPFPKRKNALNLGEQLGGNSQRLWKVPCKIKKAENIKIRGDRCSSIQTVFSKAMPNC